MKSNNDIFGDVGLNTDVNGGPLAVDHWATHKRVAEAKAFLSWAERHDADAKRDEPEKPKRGKHANDDLLGNADEAEAAKVKFKTPTLVERAKAELSRDEQARMHHREMKLRTLGRTTETYTAPEEE